MVRKETVQEARAFCCGYAAVRSGKITTELTLREIQQEWPQQDTDSFAQGMIDALNKDAYRYRAIREVAGIQCDNDD